MHRPLLSIPSSGKQYFAHRQRRPPPHRDVAWSFAYEELIRNEQARQAMRDLDTAYARRQGTNAPWIRQGVPKTGHRTSRYLQFACGAGGNSYRRWQWNKSTAWEYLNVHPRPASASLLLCPLRGDALGSLYTTTWWRGQHQCVRARNLMQAICCGRRAAANSWFLLRLGRLQYFISQFCNTKNLLRPQKKWLKISLIFTFFRLKLVFYRNECATSPLRPFTKL